MCGGFWVLLVGFGFLFGVFLPLGFDLLLVWVHFFVLCFFFLKDLFYLGSER